MDAVVCKIDFESSVLEYAAANNPIYLIRDNKLDVLPAQKMPVGYSDSTEPFVTNTIQLKSRIVFILLRMVLRINLEEKMEKI